MDCAACVDSEWRNPEITDYDCQSSPYSPFTSRRSALVMDDRPLRVLLVTTAQDAVDRIVATLSGHIIACASSVANAVDTLATRPHDFDVVLLVISNLYEASLTELGNAAITVPLVLVTPDANNSYALMAARSNVTAWLPADSMDTSLPTTIRFTAMRRYSPSYLSLVARLDALDSTLVSIAEQSGQFKQTIAAQVTALNSQINLVIETLPKIVCAFTPDHIARFSKLETAFDAMHKQSDRRDEIVHETAKNLLPYLFPVLIIIGGILLKHLLGTSMGASK